LLLDATTPGAPSPSRSPSRSPVRGEGRQTLAGAVLRVLAPLDGFSCPALRGRHPSPRSLAKKAGPLSSWSAPPELSLPGEPCPLSRTSARLRVRSPTAAGAAPSRVSRSLSPVAPALRRASPPEGGPGTHEPGRRIPAFASPVASTRLSVPHVPSCSSSALSSPVNGRHARFRALLPPGVRSATALTLARSGPPVGALLGFSPSRALSTTVRGSVSRVDPNAGQSPCRSNLRAPSRRGCIPRPGLRRLSSRAQDPSTRGVYSPPRVTVRQQPSSPSASRALWCASRQLRRAPCRER